MLVRTRRRGAASVLFTRGPRLLLMRNPSCEFSSFRAHRTRNHGENSNVYDEPIRVKQANREFEEEHQNHELVPAGDKTSPTRLWFLDPETYTISSITKHLMPRDYTVTCLNTYENYAKTTMVSSMLGTAASILSTQALLTSIGISAQSVLPLAATLNWVLKDGLGQLGGVLFASSVNTRFDADPKRFRFGADVGLALSVILESCTALVPWLFLPLASIANVGKNAAWLSASATRASIHQSFSLEHNLADVTGKAGSQTITASLAGTAIGIVATPFIGQDAMSLVVATTVFSVLHLSASFTALHFVQLGNLNIQRAWLALSPTLVTARWLDASHKSSLCALDWDKLDTPESVAKKERVVHFGRWGTQDGRAKLASPTKTQVLPPPPGTGQPNVLADETFAGTMWSFLKGSFTPQAYLKTSIHVNPSVHGVRADTLKRLLRTCDAFDDQHLLQVVPASAGDGTFVVRLFYLHDATAADVLAGFLHAALVIRALGRISTLVGGDADADSFHQLVYDVRDRIQRENAAAKFVYGVQDKGWDIKHIFIEERRENRVQIHKYKRPTTAAALAAGY